MTRFTTILISILILVSMLACTITTPMPPSVNTDTYVITELAFKHPTLAKPPEARPQADGNKGIQEVTP